MTMRPTGKEQTTLREKKKKKKQYKQLKKFLKLNNEKKL